MALDRSFGALLERLYFSTTSGEAGGLINQALAKKPDLLLLGSSRMKHHVDPRVLQAELDLSVYNAGYNGQDFLYAAMLLDLRLKGSAPPKAVVLHIDRKTFVESQEEYARAKVFSYYIDSSELVRRLLVERSVEARIKYWSRTYRANGKIMSIIYNCLREGGVREFEGYSPLSGELKVSPLRVLSTHEKSAEISKLKVDMLHALIAECRVRDIRLFLLNSPRFPLEVGELDAYRIWRAGVQSLLVQHTDVGFLEINAYTNPELFMRPELYRDDSHLNEKGAEIFSKLVAKELRRRLSGLSAKHDGTGIRE